MHHLPDCTHRPPPFTKAAGQLLIRAAISRQDAHACKSELLHNAGPHERSPLLSATVCCNLWDGGLGVYHVVADYDAHAHSFHAPDISSGSSIPRCLPRPFPRRHYRRRPLVNYQHAAEVIGRSCRDREGERASARGLEGGRRRRLHHHGGARAKQEKVIPVVVNASGAAPLWDVPVDSRYLILSSAAKKLPPHNIVNPGKQSPYLSPQAAYRPATTHFSLKR